MVLVVGGAGFVGSHVAKLLRKQGTPHVIADNLSSGHREAVLGSEFAHCDLRDPADAARRRPPQPAEEIMLCAGSISVGESVRDPDIYYKNNLGAAINLLSAAKKTVKKVVFSSTAAVYGEPTQIPIAEQHPTIPKNPYGETKLAIERLLQWYAAAYEFEAVSLRYFNAAGADPEGELGEDHDPEEHLIPLAIDAALGRRPPLTVFGDDYPTHDGTCIRDYIHVQDLAAAHLLAMEHPCPPAINLGTGRGHSVNEIIRAVERVVGPVPHEFGPRREGDPAQLVASSQLAKRALGWEPENSLEQIVTHAYEWRKAHAQGYATK